jgi:hypothetical protein
MIEKTPERMEAFYKGTSPASHGQDVDTEFEEDSAENLFGEGYEADVEKNSNEEPKLKSEVEHGWAGDLERAKTPKETKFNGFLKSLGLRK